MRVRTRGKVRMSELKTYIANMTYMHDASTPRSNTPTQMKLLKRDDVSATIKHSKCTT